MCLKVSTKRELGEAGPRAAELAVTGELPRVQVQALRTLGAVGDTEHVDVVRGLLDDEEQAVRRQAARVPGAARPAARPRDRHRLAVEITSHWP